MDCNQDECGEDEPVGGSCGGAARVVPECRQTTSSKASSEAPPAALQRKEWIEPGTFLALRSLELGDVRGHLGSKAGSLPAAVYHAAIAPFLHFEGPVPNQLYVVGGRNEEHGVMSVVEMFDTWHGQWVSCPDMRGCRAGCAVSALPSGRLLVVGGYDERGIVEGLLQTCEVFDPYLQTWSEAAARLVRARWGHGCATLGGRVYAVGGCSLRSGAPAEDAFMETLRDCEVYDPEADEWSPCAPLHTPRAGARVVALGGAYLAAVGGCDDVFGRADILASVELFDSSTGRWSLLSTQLSAPRTTAAVAALDEREILIFGGAPSLSSCEVYGVPEQERSAQFAGATPQRKVGSPPIRDATDGRMGCQAIAIDLPLEGKPYPVCTSKCIVVIGGENGEEDWDGSTRHFNGVLVYDIVGNVWRPQESFPPLPTPRTALALCVGLGQVAGRR